MNNIREHIYLAALLREIGKFYQKATTKNIAINSRINNTGELEKIFFLNNEDENTLWTRLFIKENEHIFKRLLENSQNEFTKKDNLRSLINAQSQQIVQIFEEAKLLSSSKNEIGEEEPTKIERNCDTYNNDRLIPILQTIGSHGELLNNKEWYQRRCHINCVNG